MKTIKLFESRSARRIAVAMAIMCAAAAVTATVVLTDRPLRSGAARLGAAAVPAAGEAAFAAAPAASPRSPKDAGRRVDPPWVKHAAGGAEPSADASVDTSVPPAADALGTLKASADGSSPSF